MIKPVQDLLEKRYFVEDEEKWEELVDRVATNIAKDEQQKEVFFNMIRDIKFIPSSPCLMNAGTNVQQLSSCFIVDIKRDTIEDIMRVAGESAKIFQKNGGKLIASHQ